MGVHPVVARQLRRRRMLDRLPNLTRDLGRSARARATIRITPDRVARADHWDLYAVLIPDPENSAGACFVTVILPNQDRQQTVGLACEDLVRLQGVGGIELRHVEADSTRVGFPHQG